MANQLQKIANYFFPTTGPFTVGKRKTQNDFKKNLSGYITPVQLQRIRHDVQLWREAIAEAEQAYYPHRVKMQRLYMDTVLNAHVQSCISRRKNLTLLKDFKLCSATGDKNEKLTALLKKKWFFEFVSHAMDSIFFGYSLISLGSIANDEFPELTIVRRFNISPDRLNATAYVYSLSGENFLDEPFRNWHVWAPTPTDVGISPVGYGLLYKVAMYEILCRNVLGFNADAAELYGMPMRVGKTNKTDQAERDIFFAAMLQMGNAGAILMDTMDELELVESKSSGQGYKIYESLESRCEKKISKLILGHADAMDSIPGKLGGGNGDESPVSVALADIQTVDCRFIENIVNSELLPKMRILGFQIPDDIHFEFKNDSEREQLRQREDQSNKTTADIAKIMKDAGLAMDAGYFQERTGIPTTAIESPEPVAPFSPDIKNKLDRLYR